MRSLLRMTTPDVNTLGLEESDKWLLPQFVQLAKQHVGPSLFSLSGSLQIYRTSIPCFLLEVGQVHNTSPQPLPQRQIVLHLLGQSWMQSSSTTWMELKLSTFAYKTFGNPVCSSQPQLGGTRKAGNWLQRRVAERYCQLAFLPTDAPPHERTKSYDICCGSCNALRRPRW